MRARNVKPTFFQNEQLAELPFEARLLFVGLWCLADRSGRLEDRPKRIKMHVFPADMLDIEPLLQGLASQKLIVRYAVDGAQYIWIPGFLKHQRPHSKEALSQIPPFHEEPKAPTQVGARTDLGDGEHALIPDSGYLIPESSPPESMPPPAGLDLQAWNRWEAYRRDIRKPIKPASMQAAQRSLAGFGADQAAAVEQSIAQGWTGLFPLKENANGTRRQVSQPRPSAVERTRAATEKWLRDSEATGGDGLVIDV